MSLAKPDYKRKSQNTCNKKTLESELDRICKDKKKQREYKKQLFNQNIKSHIVYMDENGIIQENSSLHSYNRDNELVEKRLKQMEKQEKKKKIIAIIVFLIFIFYVLCYCYEMHTGNVIIY